MQRGRGTSLRQMNNRALHSEPCWDAKPSTLHRDPEASSTPEVEGEVQSNIKDKGEADRTGWRPMLEKSIKKNRSEVTSKYIQLATVRDDGTVPNPKP